MRVIESQFSLNLHPRDEVLDALDFLKYVDFVQIL